AKSRLVQQSEYGFRHALVRDAAYSLLTNTDLATGHRLAGEFLATAREPNAAAIAEHYQRGGYLERAAGFYRRAAEESLLSGDYRGALRWVDQALSCSPNEMLCAELRSLECAAAAHIDRLDRIANAAEYAIGRFRPGSLGWSRVVIGAIFGA